MKIRIFIIAIILAATICGNARTAAPKREFRGAWLHTVFQDQYRRQSTAQNKAYLRRQLDSLAMTGVNAIIFQVRPQADAFYDSRIEAWSCYLTAGGKAPVPYWDPLEFMITEAHARGMELHAWLNPYRVTSNTKQIASLPKKHIYRSHPERFLTYGGKLYFDPALPENREYIGRVVDDIVARYDIDGIHFDDYFYPYPIAGKKFPDNKSYRKYGNGMKLADWRRHNVDLLIENIHRRIKAVKPWVRFGISPFGIYRNKTSDPRGSDTRGLENYDGLYADVLLWAQKGWIDYLIPQLYWELDHKAASYTVLADWWDKADSGECQIYIGQDVERTMMKPDIAPSADKSQLNHKLSIARQADRIQGVCWWPGYAITRNICGIADSLGSSHGVFRALVPEYPRISTSVPPPVSGITLSADNSFTWKTPATEGKATDVIKYAVYRFESRKEIDTGRAGALVAVTYTPSYTPAQKGVYVVTAINRANVESKPSAAIYIR